jgi:hypothetical protein
MASVRLELGQLRIALVAPLLLVGVFVAPLRAGTTYNVSTVSQLEAAIANVNAGPGGDTIVLAAGFYALNDRLLIDQDVTIQGDALSPTIIDGGGMFSILDIRADNVSVQNLTLQHGLRAIGYGGSGVLSATGLTITGNESGVSAGDSSGTSFFTNSTIANNTGQGITISCADLRLTNVTVSGNAVGVNFSKPCGERMEITNSLIVKNAEDCGGSGNFVPVGTASFDSDGSCVAMNFGPGLTTRSLATLGLGALAQNGGPTPTQAIASNSPAVDAADNSTCPATDQRGFLRHDGACDIGAFERGASPGGGNTPTGTDVSVSPAPGVTVAFSQVIAAGDTTVTTGGPLPPSGFQVDGLVYDISTTAVFTPPVTVCLPYSPSTNPAPRLFHFENVPPPAWVNRTTSVDAVHHIVCGAVTSLSPFAVLAPISISRQLQDLQAAINSFNLQKQAAHKFTHRVDKLRRALASDHKHGGTRFCAALARFVHAVEKQSGNTLTTAEANEVLMRAAAIAASAGC